MKTLIQIGVVVALLAVPGLALAQGKSRVVTILSLIHI